MLKMKPEAHSGHIWDQGAQMPIRPLKPILVISWARQRSPDAQNDDGSPLRQSELQTAEAFSEAAICGHFGFKWGQYGPKRAGLQGQIGACMPYPILRVLQNWARMGPLKAPRRSAHNGSATENYYWMRTSS